MAEKSAHIDATLRVAGLSELFTQDIENMFQDNPGKGDIPAGDGNHQTPPATASTTQVVATATDGAGHQRPEP